MHSRSATLLACLCLAAVVLAVFYPVHEHDFLNMDDPFFVEKNQVPEGLSPANIKRAFTMHYGMWMPLTWLSHMTDAQVYGRNPAGHHLTSLFIHMANAVLLFLLLRIMTGAFYKSLLVAALFALHPVNVESVAYIAARKGLLAAFFWILTLLAYTWYVRRPSASRYLLTFCCFFLGLMAKPVLVTLPLILLLLDYWPLDRCGKGRRKKLILEKLPLLALAVLISLVTLFTQPQANALTPLDTVSQSAGLTAVLVNYVIYLKHIFWPVELAIFYPWPQSLSWWQPLGAAILLLSVLFKVIRDRLEMPYALVGWFWFLISLLPMIGLIRIGSHALADRYAYLPAIGIFMVIVWGGAAFLAERQWKKPGMALGLAMLFIFFIILGVRCRYQLSFWENNETIFRHALAVTKNNYAAHNNLGRAMAEQGRPNVALRHITEALRIYPEFSQAHNNLGVLLADHSPARARHHFSLAIDLRPDFAEAHYNLAELFFKNGDYTRALTHYRRTLEINAVYPCAEVIHFRIGRIMASRNKEKKALAHLHQAWSRNPEYIEAADQLARLYKNSGHYAEAIQVYLTLIQHRPDCSASIAYNLACLYAMQNEQKTAVSWLKQSIEAGFSNMEQLKSEKELDNIRETGYYQKLTEHP
ncbi:MAG: TPR end-of-group domain-containing protein [Desulfosudaceae bacterium]